MLNLAEWSEEPLIIKIHVFIALAGLIIGAVVLLRRKGTTRHLLMGRLFVGTVLGTTGTSFFIREIEMWGIWSPIHLLSLLVLGVTWYAIASVRAGNIQAHRRAMVVLYLGGFVVSSAFTLWPGRMTFEVAVEPWLKVLVQGNQALGYGLAQSVPLVITLICAYLVYKKWRPARLPRPNSTH